MLWRWLQKLIRLKHKLKYSGVAKGLRLHVEENGGFELIWEKEALSLLSSIFSQEKTEKK